MHKIIRPDDSIYECEEAYTWYKDFYTVPGWYKGIKYKGPLNDGHNNTSRLYQDEIYIVNEMRVCHKISHDPELWLLYWDNKNYNKKDLEKQIEKYLKLGSFW